MGLLHEKTFAALLPPMQPLEPSPLISFPFPGCEKLHFKPKLFRSDKREIYMAELLQLKYHTTAAINNKRDGATKLADNKSDAI